MLSGRFRGGTLGSGTGLWQMSEDVRAGKMSRDDFLAAESCMSQSSSSGVDHVLMKEAEVEHKETRYLETVEQQMALIVPHDPALELQEFEADLKELHDEKDDYNTEGYVLQEGWAN